MNTYFYGKPQIVNAPTITSDGKGTFVLHSVTDTGKVVKVFAFTAADLASLVAMSKAAPVDAPAPAPAPAPVRKAKTTVPADLDAEMASLLSLLTSMRGMDAPVKPATRKARKATGGK